MADEKPLLGKLAASYKRRGRKYGIVRATEPGVAFVLLLSHRHPNAETFLRHES